MRVAAVRGVGALADRVVAALGEARGRTRVEHNLHMAIIGTHALVYTSEPEAVRAIFRDVFGWPFVDEGGGWLIFALPPAELGVHPAEGPATEGGHGHQVTLMCDDLTATIRELRNKGVEIRGEPQSAGFGIMTTIVLPGNLEMMLYEPRHRTAI